MTGFMAWLAHGDEEYLNARARGGVLLVQLSFLAEAYLEREFAQVAQHA
jgi:hypothetical protein